MAKKGARVTIKLESEDGSYTYYSQKNTRNSTEKLKLRKHNPVTNKHELFTEGKMK